MPDEPLTIILLILFLLGSMYCSATETAFMAANRFKIKAKAEEGSISAKLASWVLVRLENSIVSIVILNNVVNTLFTTSLTIMLVEVAPNNAELFTTLISVPILFLIGETIPKILAKRYNESFSMISSYFLVPFIFITYPISIIFRGVLWLIKKVFHLNDDNIFSKDDFENVIESIEEKGIINEDASELIISTLEFSETAVKDVLTPKNKIKAFDLSKFTISSFNEFLINTEFSRIPIYEGSIDKLVGVIVVREYVKVYQRNKDVNLRSIMVAPYFVNYKITMNKMVEGFKKNNTHIAFVLDDNKKLIGMITMEDVLEELAGQIAESNTSVKEANANG